MTLSFPILQHKEKKEFVTEDNDRTKLDNMVSGNKVFFHLQTLRSFFSYKFVLAKKKNLFSISSAYATHTLCVIIIAIYFT